MFKIKLINDVSSFVFDNKLDVITIKAGTIIYAEKINQSMFDYAKFNINEHTFMAMLNVDCIEIEDSINDSKLPEPVKEAPPMPKIKPAKVEFKIGDVVRLKSDQTPMTVVYEEETFVVVAWLDNDRHIQEYKFDVNLLELIK